MTSQGFAPAWRARVISQAKAAPPRVLVYAPPGTGKTTLVASIPGVLILDWDRGADQTSAHRIAGPTTWAESLELVRAISSDPSGYKALAVDTVDPLEEACARHVCELHRKSSLAEFGYGAGYEALANEWRNMLLAWDACRAKGMAVVLLGHSVVKTVQDPTLGSYDSFTAQLQKKTWAMTSRWCDVVGFANFDAAIVGDERRAIVTGERVLHTTRGSGFEAKNRYGLPAKMPLSWAVLEAAIAAGQVGADELRERITKLAAGTEHEAKAATYLADAGDDVARLQAIEVALTKKMNGGA